MVNVVIGIGQVRDMFDRLISRAESREDVARFAIALFHKLDADQLSFLEHSDARRIRRALAFLSQADLLVTDTEYRFTLQDFILERAELGLD